MNSILDAIGDYFNTPSPQIDNPSELTKLISLPGSPIQQYGIGGALHNTLLGMVNPHALGQPSMYEMMQAANNGDENARRQVAMNLAGSFTGMTDPVFHGTGAAPFEKFTNEAIGSGEGNQSYGYGHYLASNPSIANSYKMSVGGPDGNILQAKISPEADTFLDLDKPLNNQSEHVTNALNQLAQNLNLELPKDKSAYTFIHTLGYNLSPETASNLLNSVGISGNKYLDASSRAPLAKVKYSGDTSNPLIHQGLDILNQSGVSKKWEVEPKEQLQQLIDNYTSTLNNTPEKYIVGGKEGLTNKLNALKSLNPDHITGLDQTHNYVVFDPNDIEITHWNGVPVKEE